MAFFQPKPELDWQLDANCAGPGANPQNWDIESLDRDGDLDAQAQALCEGCPVMAACLNDAESAQSPLLGFPDDEDGELGTVGVVRGGKAFDYPPEAKKPVLKRRAWIAEFNALVDEGRTHDFIRMKMGLTLDAYTLRLRRYGCKRDTAIEAKCKEMIQHWVDVKMRFTSFDLPYGTPLAERQFALMWAVREGLVRKLGNKPNPNPKGHPLMMYGQPDWPEFEPSGNLRISYWHAGEVRFGVNIYGNVSLYA
ncbi:WhiB family transcription factor [Gordonia phage Trax]|uniref:WhiB family transcription factor n=1 Tax=Gordonia phage Trax TaxID=2591121 RepID=A0A515MH00_9CAUD|nr:WhiB family transcription factor [Gordonia phage Trax]QDM55949.1 WhiB family transcription factor [Gordonia phage Trax]